MGLRGKDRDWKNPDENVQGLGGRERGGRGRGSERTGGPGPAPPV